MVTTKKIVNEKKRAIKRAQIKRIISTVAFFAIMIAFGLIFYYSTGLAAKSLNGATPTEKYVETAYVNDLKIHFADVGQGDSIIIQLPNGQNMLIDAGSSNNSDALLGYIDSLNIKSFDYLLATHCHEDHIGGMPAVFNKYQIKHVFRPYILCTTSPANEKQLSNNFNVGATPNDIITDYSYYKFLKALQNEKSTWEFFNVNSDLTINLSGEAEGANQIVIDFLTPTSAIQNIKYNNANNFSPLICITYNNKRFMLTGDAENEVEKEFFKQNINLNVDVLKIAHHGGETSTSLDFLNALCPKYSVISCGKGNAYGHPTQSVLDNLLNANQPSILLRTDLNGNVSFTVDRQGNLSYETQKTALFEEVYTAPFLN